MRPTLTHLLAALAGAVLVFALTRSNSSGGPGSPGAPSAGASPSASTAPSRSGKSDPLLRSKTGPKAETRPEENHADMKMLEKFGAREPTRDELEAFIASRNGSAEALMAAGLILNDDALLRRAYEKDPNNQKALLALISHVRGDSADQAKWRKEFAATDINNALGSWLLAATAQKDGDFPGALQHLRDATTKPFIKTYTVETMFDVQEAYEATGSTPLGAKLQSTFGIAIQFASDVHDLVVGFNRQPDALSPEDAEEIRNITAHIGSTMTEDLPYRSILSDIIGYGIQLTSMRDLPGDSLSPFEGLTVNEASAHIRERIDAIRAISFPDPDLFMQLPEETINAYLNRNHAFGEQDAVRWLNQQIENR